MTAITYTKIITNLAEVEPGDGAMLDFEEHPFEGEVVQDGYQLYVGGAHIRDASNNEVPPCSFICAIRGRRVN